MPRFVGCPAKKGSSDGRACALPVGRLNRPAAPGRFWCGIGLTAVVSMLCGMGRVARVLDQPYEFIVAHHSSLFRLAGINAVLDTLVGRPVPRQAFAGQGQQLFEVKNIAAKGSVTEAGYQSFAVRTQGEAKATR